MKNTANKRTIVLVLLVLICHAQYTPIYDYGLVPYFQNWYSTPSFYYSPYAATNSRYYFQQPSFNIPAFVSTPSMSSNSRTLQGSTSRDSTVQAILDRANGVTTTTPSFNAGLTNLQTSTNPTRINADLQEQQQVSQTLDLVDTILNRANPGLSQSTSADNNNQAPVTSTTNQQSSNTDTFTLSDQVREILNRANGVTSTSTTPQPAAPVINLPNVDLNTDTNSDATPTNTFSTTDAIAQILNRANQIPASDTTQITTTTPQTPPAQQATQQTQNAPTSAIQQILNRANQVPTRDITVAPQTPTQQASTAQQATQQTQNAPTSAIQEILNRANSAPVRESTPTPVINTPTSQPAEKNTQPATQTSTASTLDRIKQILNQAGQVPQNQNLQTDKPSTAAQDSNTQVSQATPAADTAIQNTQNVNTVSVADRVKEILNKSNQVPTRDTFQTQNQTPATTDTTTTTTAPANTQTTTKPEETPQPDPVVDRIKQLLNNANQVPTRDTQQPSPQPQNPPTTTNSISTSPTQTKAQPKISVQSPSAIADSPPQITSEIQPVSVADQVKSILEKSNQVPNRQTVTVTPSTNTPPSIDAAQGSIDQANKQQLNSGSANTQDTTASKQSTPAPQSSIQTPSTATPPTDSALDRIKQILNSANQIPTRETGPAPEPSAPTPATISTVIQSSPSVTQTTQPGTPDTVKQETVTTNTVQTNTAQAAQPDQQLNSIPDFPKNQPNPNSIKAALEITQKQANLVVPATTSQISQPAIASISKIDQSIQNTPSVTDSPFNSKKSIDQMIQEIINRANVIPTREGEQISMTPNTMQSSSSSTMQIQNSDGTVTTKTVTSNTQQNSENETPVTKQTEVSSTSAAPQPDLVNQVLNQARVEASPNLRTADTVPSTSG